ncbi:S49 family peptidase [Marinicauda algicola]|jgi:ClpP class serine protease|uniref:S49 family peptidase n=1 Tax=Marinicauda algicola TaxID=2029849 RepID=A0A4S2H4S3_9PROT|nr:S49 family peptidase [Marinicauda algicola]TGY90660.1 S49 family peptidase [Marinicauda algicola]
MTASHSLLTRLGGRPLAIAPRALDGLLAADLSIDVRSAIMPVIRDADPARGFTVTDSGIAVVPVLGPLVSRGDWLSALFGASDYGAIGGAVAAAFAEPSARAVLLELDSPGGEVGGLFDLVDRLAAMRDEASKPLWAVAHEGALSAGFAIASVADRLFVTRTAEVGSVGVVAIHVDESAADAMAGLKWTLIHAGQKKVDGNPHEPLSPGAFADIQADVDALHDELVALISRNRNMSPDAVRATQAAIYRGQRGIDIGFADRLGNVDQALADLAAALDRPVRNRGLASAMAGAQRRPPAVQPPRSKLDMTTDTDTEAANEDAANIDTGALDAEHAEAEAEDNQTPASAPAAPVSAPGSPVPPADAAVERLRAEYVEIAAIAAQAGRLGVAIDAADAMAKGISPEALRRSVLDALSQRAEASAVVAAAPQALSPGDSPIVRRARERAASANRNA